LAQVRAYARHGVMESFVHHIKKGKEFAHECRSELTSGKTEHQGHLDFGAYRTANNAMYTGWKPACPPIYYGKVWGFDSSNMQGCLNPIGYYKRLYYRGDPMDTEPGKERAAVPKPLPSTMRSMSEPNLVAAPGAPGATPGGPLDQLRRSQSGVYSSSGSTGYQLIRENFEEEVMNIGKPALFKKEEHERLNFHNTLPWKYDTDKSAKLRMASLPKYEYPSITHRSTPNELKFIGSMYYRTDVNCLKPSPLKRIWGDGN